LVHNAALRKAHAHNTTTTACNLLSLNCHCNDTHNKQSFKGFVATSLMHRDAYLAVLRLIASVDDTVTCQKTVLAELLLPVPRPAVATAAALGGTAGGATTAVSNKVMAGQTGEDWVPRGVAVSSGTGEAETVVAKGNNTAADGDDAMVSAQCI
jgi:ferric-dicitrate binding protein FerR (iron transport regulator)